MPTKTEYYNEIIRINALINGPRYPISKRALKADTIAYYDRLLLENPQFERSIYDGRYFNGELKTTEEHARDNNISKRTMRRWLNEQKILKDEKTNEIIRINPANINLVKQILNIGTRRARRIMETGENVPNGFIVADSVKDLPGLIKFRTRPKFTYTGQNGRARTHAPTVVLQVPADTFNDEKKREIMMKNIFIETLGYMSEDRFNDAEYISNWNYSIGDIQSGGQSFKMVDSVIREQKNLNIFNRGLKSFDVDNFEKRYKQVMKPIIEADYKKKKDRADKIENRERKTNINKKIVDYTDPITCIKRYLLLNYPKIINQSFLSDYDDITIKTLLSDICRKFKIRARVFNINAEIIADNYITKTKEKKLIICVYNNHIYEIKNMKLFIKNKEIIYNSIDKINFVNVYEKLEELIKNGQAPERVTSHNDNLMSLEFNNNVYTSQPDFKLSYEMLKNKGLINYYKPDADSAKAFNILLTHYKNGNNCYSYAPIFKNLVKMPFYWINKDCLDKYGTIKPEYKNGSYRNNPNATYTTIDKNKCYASMLKNLPFLICRDDTKHKTSIYKGEELTEHYLYYVETLEPNILISENFIYSGYYLIQVKKHFKNFKIINVFEADRIENYYKQVITDLYNTHGARMKFTFNKHIGQMTKYILGEDKEIYKFVKICNLDEASRYEHDHIKEQIGETGQYIIYKQEIKKPVNIKNNICVEWFIKDMSRLTLFNKINELKINENDLIQVKVDSILFRNNDNKKVDNIGEDMDNWKYENNKKLMKVKEYRPNKYNFMYDILNKKNKPNAIFNPEGGYYDGYAGAGKSHFIINVIVPELEGDYMILTPQHTNNTEYLKLGFNSNVVQKYEYRKQDIEANNIIVDEIGLYGSKSLKVLYKQFLQGKNIFMFGDYRQQDPVSGPNISYNQFLISEMSRGNVYMLRSNYRNMNTKADYDNMRFNMTYNEKRNMILEHNRITREQAEKDNIIIDCIICFYTTDKIGVDKKTERPIIIYSSKTKYNEIIMKKLNIGVYEPGFKTICKTNTLKKLKKYKDMELYNNQSFKVYDVKGDGENGEPEIIILTDGIKKYEILNKHYKKHFRPNYAISLFNAQGRSIEKFLICEDKKDLNAFICDNKRFYTLMSRIKTNDVLGPYTNPNQFE